MSREVVLAINPGSTSTKLALYDRKGMVHIETIDHTGTEICDVVSIVDQLPLRLEIITKAVKSWLTDCTLVAVVGRGGLVKPIKSGV